MVHEMIDGTYRQTNLPNESTEYFPSVRICATLKLN